MGEQAVLGGKPEAGFTRLALWNERLMCGGVGSLSHRLRDAGWWLTEVHSICPYLFSDLFSYIKQLLEMGSVHSKESKQCYGPL